MRRTGLAVLAFGLAAATSGCMSGGEIGTAATIDNVAGTVVYQCDDGSQMSIEGVGSPTIYVATGGSDFAMQGGPSDYSGGRGTITFSPALDALTWQQGPFGTKTCSGQSPRQQGWFYLNL